MSSPEVDDPSLAARIRHVQAFQKSDVICFLIHHGESMRREVTIDDGAAPTEVYRPERYDALMNIVSSGKLPLNAL